MADVVEICNAALNFLGDESITSLEDENDLARLCKRFYPIVRDAVLRAHPWRCALKRQELGLLASTPAFGWTYEHQLPSDCLRVVGIHDDTLEWTKESNKILSNSETMKIVYVKRVEDTGEFDSLLTDTIISRLAYELAHPITAKYNMVDAAWKMYQAKLAEARSISAQEGSGVVYESNQLIDVRY